MPIAAATSADIHWTVLLRALPEIATCVVVGIISLVVKISSVETDRSAAADIDQEFRANGAANLIAAPLGAMAGSVLVTTSKAFMDAGARTQLSGVAAASCIGLVVLAGVDLPSFLPTPVIAGFLLVMGYTMLTDALKGAIRQKSWTELILALAIAMICLRFGFIIGVLAGFICSCLIFALSYGRIGVVRRHLTRASFSGDVERAPEIERHLRLEGDAIHIYWLSGYIFFGSSEGLFERVRQTINRAAAKPPRYIVLDLAGASGMDSSAIASKLRRGRRYQSVAAAAPTGAGGRKGVATALPASRTARGGDFCNKIGTRLPTGKVTHGGESCGLINQTRLWHFPVTAARRSPFDRGRDRLSPTPPSEPYWRFSRLRLSCSGFLHRDCFAVRQAV
jgi:MFS superfamily sulfate permease-like transporter